MENNECKPQHLILIVSTLNIKCKSKNEIHSLHSIENLDSFLQHQMIH